MHESAENYLETILILKNKQSKVKSIDIVRELGFSKPSISVAMKNLKQKGYIVIDNNGFIDFTEEGVAIAEKVYERHTTITELLVKIGVNEKTAAEDACRIEHVISEESFEALKKYMKSENK